MSRTTLNSEGSSIPILSEETQAALAEFYQISGATRAGIDSRK
ncbi:unnamed protein product [Oikopleura dioica]|uniref:Uncharacterized protein n=1 Tax=Oikopleura dioica TaxID=34765 RepID=E4YRB4_OIKDI|nr:unnamed protein product [Oikopleura dioica]